MTRGGLDPRLREYDEEGDWISACSGVTMKGDAPFVCPQDRPFDRLRANGRGRLEPGTPSVHRPFDAPFDRLRANGWGRRERGTPSVHRPFDRLRANGGPQLLVFNAHQPR